jgi:hypothetical protein
MKIPSDPGPSQPPSRAADPPPSDSKSFDKVLDRKAEERQGRKARFQKGPGLDEEDANKATGGPAMVLSLTRDAGPSEVAGAAGPPDLRALDGLAHEILVVAGPGTDPKVELQFNSKTLDGLNVRIERKIERKGDEISIRFLTGSDSVAQLLTRNSTQLSEALLAKGLHVAPIQVQLAPSSPRSADTGGYNPRDGRRGQGDARRDKRQR